MNLLISPSTTTTHTTCISLKESYFLKWKRKKEKKKKHSFSIFGLENLDLDALEWKTQLFICIICGRNLDIFTGHSLKPSWVGSVGSGRISLQKR